MWMIQKMVSEFKMTIFMAIILMTNRMITRMQLRWSRLKLRSKILVRDFDADDPKFTAQ